MTGATVMIAASGDSAFSAENPLTFKNSTVRDAYHRLVEASPDKIQQIHPDLQLVLTKAQKIAEEKGYPFIVTEGCRPLKAQKQAFNRGASGAIFNGLHLYGYAADVMPLAVKNGLPAIMAGRRSWLDYKDEWKAIRSAIDEAQKEINLSRPDKQIALSFVNNDAPHVELDSKKYPIPEYKNRDFCQ
jgi:hypothetical protein